MRADATRLINELPSLARYLRAKQVSTDWSWAARLLLYEIRGRRPSKRAEPSRVTTTRPCLLDHNPIEKGEVSMNDARFLQIHTLTSYPASLLNRDDAGFAKRMPFGDADAYPNLQPMFEAPLAGLRRGALLSAARCTRKRPFPFVVRRTHSEATCRRQSGGEHSARCHRKIDERLARQ